jgi:FHS family L-fucose permease-like MFS transporter
MKIRTAFVMAIMGGAIMPKLMGHVADISNVSLSFVVVAIYGFAWSNLSGVTALRGGAEHS